MSDRKIKGGFLWKIENFSNCGHCKGKPITSPVFSVVTQFDTEWRLLLYPRGKSNEDYISCYLEYHEDNTIRIKSVSFDISLLTREGKIYIARKHKSMFVRTGKRFGFNQFCRRQSILDAKDNVLPKDILNISCHLTVDIKDEGEEKDGDTTLEELSRNFRTLLQNGEFSDVVLSASGEVYQVHQFLICARAPNLAKELGITKDKNLTNPVILESISSPVLKELLLYIYSGQVETKDADIIAGLYEVAQRYDLKRLKHCIFPGPAQCSARTRIKVVRKSFLWCIEDFSKRNMDQGLPINKFVDMGIIHLVLTCCVVENADCVQVFIRRVRPWKTQKIYFRCKVSVKGTLNKSEGSQEFERWFDKNNSESQFLILSLKRKLMFENVVFLPDDELQISLEFFASSGRQRSRMENRNCLWASDIEQNMQYVSLYQLREDLKNLWNSTDCTDLTVRVKDGEEFMVHKAILAIRSTEFQNMLRESSSNDAFYLNLQDLDLEIAWELIKYLYRGEVHAETFVVYVKLYVAAVKYNILSLIKRCVHYLVTNVTEENVCELLILGDSFKDEILLIAAQEYISVKRQIILNSDEWKQLIKEHPHLGSKLLLWLSTQIIS
ncbi:TD and POZ domain-containing protein 3 [Argiope bruennichi]|uniref:TD and POZ domain-containing protein 3 n=1 Tax=Argiope bruennichi TaxID=94029 RepID=A0A8T0FD84_ARGBR|nr:TD and POZ domain-containing protein 3 [Argiope bruennichi]